MTDLISDRPKVRVATKTNSIDRRSPADLSGDFGMTSTERKEVILAVNKLEWCNGRLFRTWILQYHFFFHHESYAYEVIQVIGRTL